MATHSSILAGKSPGQRSLGGLQSMGLRSVGHNTTTETELWRFRIWAPLSVEFSRQEYWSGLPFPTPGRLSDPGTEPRLLYIGRWVSYHWHDLEAHNSVQALGKLSFMELDWSSTPWTAAYQAPPPMGFSRQEYWSGVPLPSPSYYVMLKFIKKHLGGFIINMFHFYKCNGTFILSCIFQHLGDYSIWFSRMTDVLSFNPIAWWQYFHAYLTRREKYFLRSNKSSEALLPSGLDKWPCRLFPLQSWLPVSHSCPQPGVVAISLSTALGLSPFSWWDHPSFQIFSTAIKH